MRKQESYKIIRETFEASKLLVDETLFHVANGYLGVRGCFEEGYPAHYDTVRGTYINGFYDLSEVKHGEKLQGFIESKQKIINLMDVQGIKLSISGDTFSLFEGEVLSYKRQLDMKAGFTIREVTWRSPKGHEVEVIIKRMASFVVPELFTIDYTVSSLNYQGKVEILSTQDGEVANYFDPKDPRVAGEYEKHLIVEEIKAEGGMDSISCKTATSGLKVCSMVSHSIPSGTKVQGNRHSTCSSIHLQFDLKPGETYRLIKYCVFTDSIRYVDCEQQGQFILKEALETTIDCLYEKQENYLRDFWEQAEVTIKGDEGLEQGIHFNIYQLLQSVGKDKYSNIAAKGLSGEGYEGHYFWDTEIYMLPFFLLTNPPIAQNLLNYRYEKLEWARQHARIMGHKQGALYPWRTISGSECSAYYPSGSAQYHINGDIAYMFVQYYLITEDRDFMLSKGAEVLFETARLWIDTGHFIGDCFRIEAVTGPDEYTCLVNNNYYTNAMAKYNLKWAVKGYEMLKEEGNSEKRIQGLGVTPEEVELWQKASEGMYLPYDKLLDINPQDDSFLMKAVWDFENTPKEHYPLLLHYHPLHIYRYQVCKQPDTILAHFLLEDEQAFTTIENSYKYYEKITTHDSSLSTCIFSIMAARLGQVEKAYNYFMETTRLDLDNTHKNTKDGIHTANMGGTYMGIVYGFAGLRIKETGIYFNPSIPKAWEEYSFKIKYKQRVIRMKVNHEKVEYILEKGEPLTIHIGNSTYLIEDTLELKLLPTNYKAVIFDLDGVLVDTAKYHFLAWKEIAKDLGFEFKKEDNERLKGVSRQRSLDILLEVGGVVLSEEEKAKVAERKNALYVDYISRLTEEDILPGVLDFVKDLREKGIKLAIGSASKNTPLIIQRLGIKDYFDAISDGNVVQLAKPNPEVFLKAAEMLKVEPEECIVFEDAKAGIEAAKAAGMYAIGVGSQENLPGADRWISTMEELFRSRR